MNPYQYTKYISVGLIPVLSACDWGIDTSKTLESEARKSIREENH